MVWVKILKYNNLQKLLKKQKTEQKVKTNLGGRSIDADVIERARGLVPVLQGLTSHTDKPSGPVETISRDE